MDRARISRGTSLDKTPYMGRRQHLAPHMTRTNCSRSPALSDPAARAAWFCFASLYPGDIGFRARDTSGITPFVAKICFPLPKSRRELSDNCQEAMRRQNTASEQTNCRTLLQFIDRNLAILGGIKISETIQQHGLQLTGFRQYVMDALIFLRALEFPLPAKRTKKMPEADKISHEDLLRMTSEVAAAYVSNNSLAAAQLPEVIRTIHASLAGLQTGAGSAEPLTPAVPVKKSVHDDYIICLEDGKKLKMLKRHLRTAYGL